MYNVNVKVNMSSELFKTFTDCTFVFVQYEQGYSLVTDTFIYKTLDKSFRKYLDKRIKKFLKEGCGNVTLTIVKVNEKREVVYSREVMI